MCALQNLHEYLNNLVEAISITPSDEATLRNPQVVLDAARTNIDDDASQAVEQVRFCLAPLEELFGDLCGGQCRFEGCDAKLESLRHEGVLQVQRHLERHSATLKKYTRTRNCTAPF